MKRYIKSAAEGKIFTQDERIRLFGVNPQGKLVIPDGYTEIGKYAFRFCEQLTDVIIPDSVTRIGDDAFEGCTKLSNITIPDSVKRIDWGAFSVCKSLTHITIPDSVIRIGAYVFNFCIGLTSVTIPDSVELIGGYAFYNCRNLKSIEFEGDINSIEFGEGVFEETPLKNKFSGYVSNDDVGYEDEEYNDGHISLDTWEDVKIQLGQDCENYGDPLYEQTDTGAHIEGLCQDVESDYGVWLEPSVQGGRGGIWVYTTDDDTCVAEAIDYEDFNSDVIDIALSSDSEEDFKNSYRVYLENSIEQHPYEDEDEEY